MWGSLDGALDWLFGRRVEDPLTALTPDQLAIVLKSIESKYNDMKDDNERLRERVAAQQEEINRLTRELADRPPAPSTGTR